MRWTSKLVQTHPFRELQIRPLRHPHFRPRLRIPRHKMDLQIRFETQKHTLAQLRTKEGENEVMMRRERVREREKKEGGKWTH